MALNERDIIRVEGSDEIFDRRRVLAVLLIPMAMALMAISSVNVALPSIQIGLGATDTDIQWILSGYALAFGVVLVPGGRLGDVIGRGTLFVVGIAIFTLASLLCGLAPTAMLLNVFRFLMGFGAGLNSPQVNGMIQQYYQGQDRARAFSYFGLVVSASVAAGPLMTGAIIQAIGPEWGWRVSFLVNVLIGVVCVWMALKWLPFDTERKRKIQRRLGTVGAQRIDLDPVGNVVLILAVLGIMLPFMLKTWWGWFLVPVSIVLLWLWLRWERRYTAAGKSPMVDLRLFRHRNFNRQTLMSGIMFVGTTSIMVVLALYVQGVLGANALEAALVTLPNAIVSAFFAVWAGIHALRIGRSLVVFALACVVGSVAAAIGVAWLIELYDVSFWWLILPLVFVGVGMGTMGSVNQTLAVIDIPSHAGGVAGGVKQTTERIGTAIGNAAITAIYYVALSSGGAMAVTLAYSAIILVVGISLTIAIIDRRQQGPGVVERVEA